MFIFTKLFIPALYLDPRFQCILDSDKKVVAKRYLAKTWEMMAWLVNGTPEITDDDIIDIESDDDDDVPVVAQVADIPPLDYIDASDSSTLGNGATFELDEIEQFIRQKMFDNRHLPRAPIPQYNNAIRAKVESFDNTPRLHHSTDVRKFWEARKFTEPELYKLAQIFLSVPVNNVIIFELLNFLINIIMSILFNFNILLVNLILF